MADLVGSQWGHGAQVSLAHQVRDVQYAIDAGDTIFAPAMLEFLQGRASRAQARMTVPARRIQPPTRSRQRNSGGR